MTVAQQKIYTFIGQQRSELDDQEFNVFRTIMTTMHKSDEAKFGALAKANVLINQLYPDRSVADLNKDATLAQKLHQAVIGSSTAVVADVMEETAPSLPDERLVAIQRVVPDAVTVVSPLGLAGSAVQRPRLASLILDGSREVTWLSDKLEY